MKEVLEKLSSYNIFNYLMPGIIFAVLASRFTGYALMQKDVLVGAFVYYFIGLVISRVGSIVVEPLLEQVSFLHFASYADFVAASKKDGRLEVLSEQNNSYRTLCSLFLVILLLKTYEKIAAAWPSLAHWTDIVLLALMLVIFLFAYRKQTAYITERIGANLGTDATGFAGPPPQATGSRKGQGENHEHEGRSVQR